VRRVNLEHTAIFRLALGKTISSGRTPAQRDTLYGTVN
jgi:hypothetical protein